MVPFVVRLKAKRAAFKERLLKTDWVGAFLFISSTCSFLIGVTWGGTQYAWDSWRTIVPIVLGVVGIIATLCWERYGAPQPFIRLWLFKDYAAVTAYMCAVFQGLIVSHPSSPFRFPHVILNLSPDVRPPLLPSNVPPIRSRLWPHPLRCWPRPHHWRPHPNLHNRRLPHDQTRLLPLGHLVWLGLHRRLHCPSHHPLRHHTHLRLDSAFPHNRPQPRPRAHIPQLRTAGAS